MSTSTLRTEFNSSPDGASDWIVRIDAASEWGDYGMDEWAGTGCLPFFGPMSECPAAILDREFDDGYGAPERPTYTVWTTNYIVVPHEYDGATSASHFRRNPSPDPGPRQ